MLPSAPWTERRSRSSTSDDGKSKRESEKQNQKDGKDDGEIAQTAVN